MPYFELTQPPADLPYASLSLIGQCCKAAQAELVMDRCIPVSAGMRTGDLSKSVVGLIALDKSDFEAIEPFRTARFFREAPDVRKVPSSEWLRQRLDAKGEHTDKLSLRLLGRTEAPVSAHKWRVDFVPRGETPRGLRQMIGPEPAKWEPRQPE